MLLAAAAEPSRGWGGPIALVVAFVVFRLFVLAYTKIKNPSPPPPATPTPKSITAGQRKPRPIAVRPEPRVDPDPDLHDTRFPDRGGEAKEPWYGPIVEAGGRRFRAAAHIAKTGDSPPPELTAPEPKRDDFDDALELLEEEDR